MITFNKMRLGAALLVLSVSNANAGQATAGDLLMDGDSCRLAAMTMSMSSTAGMEKANDDLQAAAAKLDADVIGAIKSTKSKSLKAAVKEYYAAASAYCQGPNGLLENALRAKESALRLEMKLSK